VKKGARRSSRSHSSKSTKEGEQNSDANMKGVIQKKKTARKAGKKKESGGRLVKKEMTGYRVSAPMSARRRHQISIECKAGGWAAGVG